MQVPVGFQRGKIQVPFPQEAAAVAGAHIPREILAIWNGLVGEEREVSVGFSGL